MAIITETATELSLVLKIGENPKALYVHYQRIDSNLPNGCIYSPIRPLDLVVPQEEGETLVNRVLEWITEVKNNQNIRNILPLADLPFEVTSTAVESPEGINYRVEIGTHGEENTLEIDINWTKNTDEVTIFAGAEFTIPFEAFIYYVDTLVDLIETIKIEKAS